MAVAQLDAQPLPGSVGHAGLLFERAAAKRIADPRRGPSIARSLAPAIVAEARRRSIDQRASSGENHAFRCRPGAAAERVAIVDGERHEYTGAGRDRNAEGARQVMGFVQFEESARIDVAPAIVYGIIADYERGHPSILPPRAFSDMKVERGGYGAGTVVSWQLPTWIDCTSLITCPDVQRFGA